MLLKAESIKSKNIVFSVVIIVAMTLSGCSIFGKSSDNDKNADKKGGLTLFTETAVGKYNRANSQMQANKFDEALEIYNEFIIQYPFGELAERARLERIFVLNKLGETEEASASTESFIAQYPLHPNIDYAYYMRGVIFFEKKRTSVITKLAGAREVKRNKNNLERSFNAFEDLINKYPNSQYVPDARLRMTYLRNKMGEYEMQVANFYADRNAHIATINRTKFIIENYDQAPAVIDALNLMVSTYQEMGLTDKANETKALLNANYAGLDGIKASNKKEAKKPFFRIPSLNPFKKKDKKS